MEYIERYMEMGGGQFLRDFRQDHKINKTLAFRKALSQRKEKAEENKMKINLAQIEQDRSPRKKVSHAGLSTLANNLQYQGLCCLYNKAELQRLSAAYDIQYSRNGIFSIFSRFI